MFFVFASLRNICVLTFLFINSPPHFALAVPFQTSTKHTDCSDLPCLLKAACSALPLPTSVSSLAAALLQRPSRKPGEGWSQLSKRYLLIYFTFSSKEKSQFSESLFFFFSFSPFFLFFFPFLSSSQIEALFSMESIL